MKNTISTKLQYRKHDGLFPKLMIDVDHGAVLLCTACGKGTLLNKGTYNADVGHYSDCWNTHRLQDYYGSVNIA